MEFVILKNELPISHYYWEKACIQLGTDYSVIELASDGWLDDVKDHLNSNVHFLACPPGVSSKYKQMYDERIYIVSKILKQKVYPSYESIILHENKRILSYWLKANGVPHPETHVFYDKEEADRFLKKCKYPIVVKTNIGASGNGVQILKSLTTAQSYVKRVFSKNGVRQKTGPNLRMGNLKNRLLNFVKNPEHRRIRINEYKAIYNDPQKGFVLFQEFIKHDYEWRIVKIGSAYFAYQKVTVGERASGAKRSKFVIPPLTLLEFVKQICEEFDFYTMAIDLFENPVGGYLVNEMQCVFGHVNEYIYEQNGKPGKLVNEEGEWKFYEGYYNNNKSYNERLKQYISKIDKGS